MAQVNPIVFIPPTVLLLAIIGILIYRYFDTVQDTYYNILYRIRERNRDGTAVGDEEEEESFDEESEDVEQEEIYAHDQLGGDDDDQDEIEPQGSTTSARLRMHHEMVQQMRARAGFAPEPFPGDEDENVGGGDGDEEGEEGETEDDGGVGSSTGAMAGASAGRIKKIGKKKAEKLQRKEQMRAYREVTTAASPHMIVRLTMLTSQTPLNSLDVNLIATIQFSIVISFNAVRESNPSGSRHLPNSWAGLKHSC
ncbi:hypothetical protein BC939DRAFT_440691 [Gamsiella multidivaricata]|uniref:uncharacterized protein n=1 Tax=Gamsiella multidivaricata TaxID=101098 RepID=UPI002220471E|nr:uncharacterized protein BC939DRAFT_440691 [Gamsiella multidivaricata]KAI7829812.1 hypothetical protein BC939DRAFT_440691 [Gamsiella multidivaricata]